MACTSTMSSDSPIHGGSLRIYVEPNEQVGPAVQKLLAEEKTLGIDKYPYYETFANKVKDIRKSLREMCSKIKAEGKRIAAYGAAAKGSTLVNYVGLGHRHHRLCRRSQRSQAGQIHARRAHPDPRSQEADGREARLCPGAPLELQGRNPPSTGTVPKESAGNSSSRYPIRRLSDASRHQGSRPAFLVSRMRLFVYLHDFPADDDAPHLGICKAVHGLAQGFAENGHPVVVLCEGDQDSVRQLAPGYEVRCVAAASPARLYGSVSSGLRHFVLENQRDALYVLNGIFNPGVCALAGLLRQLNVPYIVAPHDPYHPTIFSKNSLLKWPYWYLRERPMLNGALAVQVLDARHGQWLARLGVGVPVIEATNGYAPSDVLPEDELNFHYGKRPSAMFMGRLDSHNKGLDILIDAVAAIPAETRPHADASRPRLGRSGGPGGPRRAPGHRRRSLLPRSGFQCLFDFPHRPA